MPERIRFFDTDLNITTRTELLGAIENGETVRVATVNPEFMLETEKNESFQEALGRMTHCTVDGSGVLGMLKFGKRKLRITKPLQMYHGADLVEDLFKRYSDGSKKFFFLGGLDDAAVKAVDGVKQKYPSLQIAGALGGGTVDRNHPFQEAMGNEVLAANPDILLVGFGAPRQELWIDAARSMPIQVMIGIGGTFNFYGTKKRAPRFMQVLHFEWLYRVLTEKGHLKRAWQAVVIFPLHAIRWLGTR